jgi:hypothetical protein
LKDEDAQCFKVNINVEPIFYILFAAALLLLAVNSFVTKAVSQCFRELETDGGLLASINEKDVEKCESRNSIVSSNSLVIVPVPVLFTDQFHWLLRQEIATHETPGISESICSTSDEVPETPLE